MKATILVPTTKERGPLLPYSVGSILNQTEQDFEIFIIGDGVDEETRKVVLDLQKLDNRIKFFDHPKGPRRGEIYRHQALKEHAQGEIVCYLLDRDLMLPDHVEKMYGHLQSYNFCAHTSIKVTENRRDTFTVLYKPFIGTYKKSSPLLRFVNKAPFFFSQVGHTLNFYKQLPYGWRTTPSVYPTDVYMWQQFVRHDYINLISSSDLTILYFKRGSHPGLSVEERVLELVKYYAQLNNEKEIDMIKRLAFEGLIEERANLRSSRLLVRGYDLWEVPAKIFAKYKPKW
ncbi:glycosyltransferase family 2 protein [Reichenbachiella carrageenanivorans]|uniref:Glycosyltransferase family 2 protein n=1 Tax=Reichenbachiella carrageenanivorans TaxID=2979869 RepID=A0ABY6D2M2_9BACT|nr:glycosyltransferase family 2 protein [Reichenbachiella carrageenanivorans]UXX80410.1 glycosyltransferase family 2 protein [Reichenbachiella carrageenanivorans]